MQNQLLELARLQAALLAGGMIGVSFGMIQESAWRRHQKLQGIGKLATGWAVMPGSMGRVAGLLLALALVQLLCPLLFTDGCQWWVSGGVVAGYGAKLFSQLRKRIHHTQ